MLTQINKNGIMLSFFDQFWQGLTIFNYFWSFSPIKKCGKFASAWAKESGFGNQFKFQAMLGSGLQIN